MSIFTTSDRTELYYKDWGQGQPVVFSHGWPLSRTQVGHRVRSEKVPSADLSNEVTRSRCDPKAHRGNHCAYRGRSWEHPRWKAWIDDAMVAVPVAVRRPMSVYDYNNSRDFPVARQLFPASRNSLSNIA
jgi:hypothetical protein